MRIFAAAAIAAALLAGCAAPGPKHVVVLSVSAQDPDTSADVTYAVGAGAESHQESDVDTPWTATVDDTSKGVAKIVLTAALAANPDAVVAGTVFTCKVTVDGKAVVTRSGKDKVSCTVG
ncbi:hypothetical protein [Fodinicola acaciae]|uniref:hypothetical protein n=1 Tax=Fodinicola acaciae TaxID=2681555 RepID=UPI0013CFFC81|nr:hypothetical protein [Fodinicola acaciae]